MIRLTTLEDIAEIVPNPSEYKTEVSDNVVTDLKIHYTQKNDIILNTIFDYDTFITKTEGMLQKDHVIIRLIDKNYNPYYIANILTSEFVKNQIYKNQKGAYDNWNQNIRSIDINKIPELELPICSFKEQKTYGEIFKHMDEIKIKKPELTDDINKYKRLLLRNIANVKLLNK